jgi:hypothetical protein
VADAIEPVGICGSCGRPVMLVLGEGRRWMVSMVCPCGVSSVPEEFFATAGYGDAERERLIPQAAPAPAARRRGWRRWRPWR